MQQISNKSFRINNQITAAEVRVIGNDGEMVGVISISQALQSAVDSGLDLIEVSPHVSPPVCKIGNFGKMKYEMQKKAADAKKKQKIIDTKEVKMSLNIGKGDYEVKLRQIIKFIEKGDKVKFSLRMKGREMAHLELARKLVDGLAVDLDEIVKFEFGPRMEGRQMIAILVKK